MCIFSFALIKKGVKNSTSKKQYNPRIYVGGGCVSQSFACGGELRQPSLHILEVFFTHLKLQGFGFKLKLSLSFLSIYARTINLFLTTCVDAESLLLGHEQVAQMSTAYFKTSTGGNACIETCNLGANKHLLSCSPPQSFRTLLKCLESKIEISRLLDCRSKW